MKKGDSLRNSTSLIVYLVKMLQSSYKQGKRVKGLISHLLVMAEKVELGYYRMESLVGYDDECREVASEKGMRAFAEIRPAGVLRFLSYDSTMGAKRQQGQQGQWSQNKKQESRGFCQSSTRRGAVAQSANSNTSVCFVGRAVMAVRAARKARPALQEPIRGIEVLNSLTSPA